MLMAPAAISHKDCQKYEREREREREREAIKG